MRIIIDPDFDIKEIAGRPVAGRAATVVQEIRLGSGFVIAEVDGLAPYGHNGQIALAPGSYEVVV